MSIVCGTKKPWDLFSFLYPTLKELLILEKEGLNITVQGGSLSYKARLLLTIGDTPAMADLCCHSGHSSYNGCRMCTLVGRYSATKRGLVFPPKKIVQSQYFEKDSLRTIQDYTLSNKVV